MATHNCRDLFVVGGGINGCGIAPAASGRCLSGTLAEMIDLASETSSASTKLFHGGLRYLECFEFRLVREALMEREGLLRALPHTSWPMRFGLLYQKDMRFESETPSSKLLSWVMPWMEGCRPAWLIRLGLFMYDHLGGRQSLPGTSTLSRKGTKEGAPLEKIGEHLSVQKDPWAAGVPLPGGDFPADGVETLVGDLQKANPFLSDFWAKRLVRAYGTEAPKILERREGRCRPQPRFRHHADRTVGRLADRPRIRVGRGLAPRQAEPAPDRRPGRRVGGHDAGPAQDPARSGGMTRRIE